MANGSQPENGPHDSHDDWREINGDTALMLYGNPRWSGGGLLLRTVVDRQFQVDEICRFFRVPPFRIVTLAEIRALEDIPAAFPNDSPA